MLKYHDKNWKKWIENIYILQITLSHLGDN